MSIQEKLSSLRPYVIGIRYINDMPVIDADLKENWSVLKNDQIKKVQDDQNPTRFIFLPADDADVEIDDILGYVERVINYNRENERKHELLQEKVQELKEVFKNHSLEELQNLKFEISEDVGKSDDLLGSDNLVDPNLEEDDPEATSESKKEDNENSKKPKKEESNSKKNGKSNSGKKNESKKESKKEHTTSKVPNNKVDLPTQEEVEQSNGADDGECNCDHSKGEYCDKCMEEAGF